MDWREVEIIVTKIAYNFILLVVCMLFSLGLIQHAMFFYSFPPDFSRFVDVSVLAYIVLGLILFFALKMQYWLAKRSELLDTAVA